MQHCLNPESSCNLILSYCTMCIIHPGLVSFTFYTIPISPLCNFHLLVYVFVELYQTGLCIGKGGVPPFLQECIVYLCGTKVDLVEDNKKARKVDVHMVRDYTDG